MFRRLAVVKRIASSTERESKQSSRRPVLKCAALREYRQRWLSALTSNDLNRNRETGPISLAVRVDIISNRGSGNRDSTYKSVVSPRSPHIKVSCPHVPPTTTLPPLLSGPFRQQPNPSDESPGVGSCTRNARLGTRPFSLRYSQ